MPGGDQRRHHAGSDAQALARIDAADGQQPNRRPGAGVRSRRRCRPADSVVVLVSITRAPCAFVLLAQRRAVGKRQRPRRHAAQRPLLERDIGARTAPSSRRDSRGAAAAPRSRRRPAGTPACRGARAMRKAKIAAGRRHAQWITSHCSTQRAQPRPHRRQLRIELPRAGKVRQRRQHARSPRARASPRRRRVEHRHRQDHLVEVRRQRVDVARERSFRFPQRAVGGLPERHVIQDAERHASPLAVEQPIVESR